MSMLDERTDVSARDRRPAAGTAPEADAGTDDGTGRGAGAPTGGAGVTLHRRRGALALVGTGAVAAATAYTWRAATGASPLWYLVAAAMVPVAVVHIAAWWDASVPLLVADRTGLRLRGGRRWTGLRWEETATLRLVPSRPPRRDGRLVVEGSDGTTRALALALVDPADLRELPDALRVLAAGRADVVVDAREPESGPERDPEPDPVPKPQPEPEPEPALTQRLVSEPASPEPELAESSPSSRRVANVFPPARDEVAVSAAAAARADVVHESGDSVAPAPLGDQPVPVLPAPAHGSAEPFTAPPDPVIGPQLAAARSRLRLSVDDLAERTRIRPHVIEAIEVDDFSACGGDVYARGHVRALARVLGVEADPLVAVYEARYASAPVTARRVFEAELAGPGRALRPTSGGPRWSVLVGVVLVLVLVWGLARLLVPAPADGGAGHGRSDRGADAPADASADTSGTAAGSAAERFASMGRRLTTTLLTLSAASGTSVSTPVVVRAANGSVVFRGTVDADHPRTLRVAAPVTVVTPDAGGVLAGVGGREGVPLGKPGVPARVTLGH